MHAITIIGRIAYKKQHFSYFEVSSPMAKIGEMTKCNR